MPEPLRCVIRTPAAVVFDGPAIAVRVPTETGQVGVRPGGEPMVLAVEPGLIVVRSQDGEVLGATAGGLLETDRQRCSLLTPFARVGHSETELEAALAAVLATPPAELLARRRLEELERHILGELGRRTRKGAPEVTR